ncbi:MAG: large conductance mechanosensitive channel protein MscL [Acidimicrobiales bacterium]
MLKDFKAFILRGSVIDLAVGIVIGVAFTTVVSSFVKNLLTPLVTIPGKVNFSGLHVTVRHSVFAYGTFLNDLVSFVIVAAAVFFFVVRPVNALVARRRRGQEIESDTRDCPECLSEIPVAARRCAHCTSLVQPAT